MLRWNTRYAGDTAVSKWQPTNCGDETAYDSNNQVCTIFVCVHKKSRQKINNYKYKFLSSSCPFHLLMSSDSIAETWRRARAKLSCRTCVLVWVGIYNTIYVYHHIQEQEAQILIIAVVDK